MTAPAPKNTTKPVSPGADDLQARIDALQALLDNAPVSTFSVDRNLCYLAFNKRHAMSMLSLYGAQIGIGQKVLNNFSVLDDQQVAREAFERCLAGEQVRLVTYVGKDMPARRCFEIQHIPIRDANGAVTGVSVISQDVTEKMAAEEELKRSNALYHSLFENMNSIVLIIDSGNFDILDANPAACAFYGCSHAELTSRKISELNPATPEQLAARMQSVLEGQINQSGMTHRLPNGELRDVEVVTGPLDYKGRPALLSVVRDVTERKRGERRMADALELNQTILQASPAGILIYKASGECVAANLAAGKIIGATDQSLLMQNFHTIQPWKTNGLYEAALRALSSGQPVSIGTHSFTSFGKEIWTRGSLVPFLASGEMHLLFMFEDDTARKQAEDALRQSEQNIRSMFDTMAEGLALNEIVYDENGEMVDYRILNVNPAFYHFADFSNTQVIGSLASHLYGMSHEFIHEFWKSHRSKEKTALVEMKSTFSDRWFLISTSPFVDDKFITTFLDITERKAMEMALQASEAQYRSLIDQLPSGVFVHHGGVILLCNQAAARFFGADSPEQLVGTALMERIHPDFRELVTSRVSQIQSQNTYAPWIEEKLLRMDGSSFDAEVAGLPVLYQGQPAVLAVCNDISERLRAEQALRASEERYRRLVETSPDVVYRFSNQRGGIYYSGRVQQVFGCTPEEMLVQPMLWHDSILSEDLPHIDQTIANLPQGSNFDVEYRIRDRHGNLRWLEDRRMGSVQEGAEIIVEGLVTDITARKQAELALQAAHDELEQRVQERTADLQAANRALVEASRTKDQFLSTMSHELRTPLTGILGLSQVLLFNTYGELNERQTRAIQNIEKSGQHLHELINDILDISRLQNNKITLERRPCSLHNICRASLQMVSNLATARRQEMVLSFPPENIILEADERRLKQILINLLGNAIKFTPEGGRIELAVEGQPELREVCISVVDTGIGIKPEDIARLFKPFSQLDSSLSRQYNGTGLGLSLVKNLTELHGGRVEVESTLGVGSRFTVILPWLQ